jgi:hypothetical protein
VSVYVQDDVETAPSIAKSVLPSAYYEVALDLPVEPHG